MILIKNNVIKIMVLWCCIANLLLSQYSTVSRVTKNISDIQKMTEVKVFVKELYEAQTNKDVYWIRERLDDDDVIDWVLRLCLLYSDDFGFQEYDNLEVKAYTTSTEDYLVAVVAYDVIIERNGEELALPGYESFVVWQNENSQWCITYEHGLSDELMDEIYQLMISNELVDLFNAVSSEFNDILTRRPELAIWLSELGSETEKRVISEIFVKNSTWNENDIWDYLFGEENGILTASFSEEEDNIYTVQKGDSLWSIAEREFGDGMYWVKLYEVNRDVIGENPDLLRVGTELDLIYEKDVR